MKYSKVWYARHACCATVCQAVHFACVGLDLEPVFSVKQVMHHVRCCRSAVTSSLHYNLLGNHDRGIFGVNYHSVAAIFCVCCIAVDENIWMNVCEHVAYPHHLGSERLHYSRKYLSAEV